MKNLKLILLTVITMLTLLSCGTSHNYTNSTLNKNFYDGKTIYFQLNTKSQNTINFSGMVGTVFGGIAQPNVEETFKLSIKELANETNLNLKFIESFDEVDGEEPLIIDTDISIINWHFGFSVATLKTVINFKNIRDNREIQATGIRKSGGGDEMNNLKKSLKDATYNYLKEYQKP